MRMRRKNVYLAIFLACFFSACALAQTPAPQRGTLYRIDHQGNTAYLFGTIHVGLPTFYPLEARVTAALATATRLAVELDVRNSEPFQRALGKYGYYPKHQSIGDHLSAASFLQLKRVLGQFALPVERIRHMKPWLLANMLLGLDLERHGYARSHGLEYFLLESASAQSKPVLELESADYQLSLFDSMSGPEQEQYLRESLTDIENGQAIKKARSLIDAWSTADAPQMEALLLQSMNEKTTSSEFIQRALLDQRNPGMASKIEALLKADQVSFVGVGLLHLTGAGGLPALLRQRGYQVEKLY